MTWWKNTPTGARIPLAVVGIDGVGWTKERSELPSDAIGQRKDWYYQRIQEVADRLGGPNAVLSGDGGVLFLHSPPEVSESGRSQIATARLGYKAAQSLWTSIRVGLNLPVRIAVHCATMAWDASTGRLDDKQLDLWGHLDKDGGIKNAIVVSEDVFLALESGDREALAYAGTTRRDGIPVYCYPASCATQASPETVEMNPDQKLWEAFRNYTRTPEIAKLQYTGFRLSSAVPPTLDLKSVFVPLEVDAPDQELDSSSIEDLLLTGRRKSKRKGGKNSRPVETHERDPWSRDTSHHERRVRSRPFRDVFQDSTTQIILGEPGAGKSTLAKWLAIAVAHGRLRVEQELGVPDRRLPAPVSVGLLSKIRELHTSASVPEALALYFQERSVGSKPELETFLRNRFESGDVLLLLDGLDEVGTDRAGTVAWLQAFLAQYPRNRYVVTSRIVGFSGLPRFPGEPIVVRPFSDQQVDRYVRSFCAAYRAAELGRPDPRSDEIARDLLVAIERDARLRALARNPFLLSSIALAHRAEGRLPEHRVQLYEMFLRALCETWAWARKMVVKSEVETLKYEVEVVPILGHLAHQMHQSHPTGVAPQAFVLDALEEALVRRKSTPQEARDSATEFLRKAAEQAQVLIERGPDRWGFLHLTFQEFLVAKYLLHEEQFEATALQRRFDPRWSEVLNLGIGAMVLIQQRGKQANELVRNILDTKEHPPRAWVVRKLARNVVVAARLAAELGEAIQVDLAATISDQLMTHHRAWTDELWRRLDGSDIQRMVIEKLGQVAVKKETASRVFAAYSLGEIRSVATHKRLTPLAKDKSISVRSTVATALGRAPSSNAVGTLVEMLQDDSPTVRAAAVSSLEDSKDICRVDPLLPLLKDKSNQVREAAAKAIGAFGDVIAVNPLIDALKARAPGNEYRFVEALARLPSEDSHKALVSLLDRNLNDRWYLSETLGQVKSDVVASGIVERLRSPQAPVQIAAIDALYGGGHAGALDPLLSLFGNPNANIRAHAVRSVGSYQSARSLIPLQGLAGDRFAIVRAAVATALGHLSSDQAFATLCAMTADKSSEVRATVAEALGQFDSHHSVDALSRLILDPIPQVRIHAARALGTIESEASIPPLIKAVRDRKSFVRWTAIRSLGNLGATTTTPIVIKCLKDKTSYVRVVAMEALGKLQARDAVRPILRALRARGRSWPVLVAAEALKNIGSEAAATCVIPLLEHENAYTQRRAMELLGGIANSLPWPASAEKP